MYDKALGIWNATDPLCEKYTEWNPYTYCFDSPTALIDHDGREPGGPSLLQVVEHGIGVVSAIADNLGWGVTGVRSIYRPVNASSYNEGLTQGDVLSVAAGAFLLETGTDVAVVTASVGQFQFAIPGVVLAGEGSILLASGAKNLASGNGQVRSPNGRKGNEPHSSTIDEAAKNYDKPKKEVKIDTPGGYKSSRYADLQGTNKQTGEVENVQVGKINKNGTPVARERRAMDDIEKATGKRPIFIPYNK
jgi:hypothetical protein